MSLDLLFFLLIFSAQASLRIFSSRKPTSPPRIGPPSTTIFQAYLGTMHPRDLLGSSRSGPVFSSQSRQQDGQLQPATAPPARIPDEYVGHFRLLRQWTRKKEVAENRIKVLDGFKTANSAPRSFLRIIAPAVPKVTTEFSLTWHKIHLDFAVKLNEALLQYWKDLLSEAEKEANSLDTILKQECSNELYLHIKTTIDNQLAKSRQEVSRKRRRIADSSESTAQNQGTIEPS